ncbi:MAG TPA: hypothetical protein V6C81_21360 [Planktothrix sp.]|jgi:hypothetical protein
MMQNLAHTLDNDDLSLIKDALTFAMKLGYAAPGSHGLLNKLRGRAAQKVVPISHVVEDSIEEFGSIERDALVFFSERELDELEDPGTGLYDSSEKEFVRRFPDRKYGDYYAALCDIYRLSGGEAREFLGAEEMMRQMLY